MAANNFTNVRSFTERINQIGKKTQVELSRAIRRGGLAIKNRAVDGIISPPKTGKIAKSKHRKSTKTKTYIHQASAPGEFPAADTGALHQSITSVQTKDGPDVFRNETGANTPYAIMLELGTSKMAPRPFMGRAFDEVKPQVQASIRAAIIRGAKR